MPTDTTYDFDEAREPLSEIAFRLNPATINPETLSGACRLAGEILSCFGLANLDEVAPEGPEDDLAIG